MKKKNKQKKSIVFGGTKGIGKIISKSLKERNDEVLIVSRNVKKNDGEKIDLSNIDEIEYYLDLILKKINLLIILYLVNVIEEIIIK